MLKITNLLFLLAIGMVSGNIYAQNEPVKAIQMNVGDKAPNFKVKDNSGQTLELKKLVKKGNVVVVFYRGEWCPYCNKYLSNLQDSLELIANKGAAVVAISPEVPENVQKTIRKTKARFSLVSDSMNVVAKMFNTAYTIDKETLSRYKKYGIDFLKANGNNENILPVPATYIIDKNMQIKYVHFEPNFKIRPSIKSLLEIL